MRPDLWLLLEAENEAALLEARGKHNEAWRALRKKGYPHPDEAARDLLYEDWQAEWSPEAGQWVHDASLYEGR